MDTYPSACPQCHQAIRIWDADGGTKWYHGESDHYDTRCYDAVENAIEDAHRAPVPVRESVPESGRDDDYPQPQPHTCYCRHYYGDSHGPNEDCGCACHGQPDANPVIDVPTGDCRCGSEAHPYHACGLPASGAVRPADSGESGDARPCIQCNRSREYAYESYARFVRYDNHSHAYVEWQPGGGWFQG